jgi:hypothetical protein
MVVLAPISTSSSKNDDAELLLFDVLAFFIREYTQIRRSRSQRRLEDDAVAELAAFADGCMRMEDAVAADFNASA